MQHGSQENYLLFQSAMKPQGLTVQMVDADAQRNACRDGVHSAGGSTKKKSSQDKLVLEGGPLNGRTLKRRIKGNVYKKKPDGSRVIDKANQYYTDINPYYWDYPGYRGYYQFVKERDSMVWFTEPNGRAIDRPNADDRHSLAEKVSK